MLIFVSGKESGEKVRLINVHGMCIISSLLAGMHACSMYLNTVDPCYYTYLGFMNTLFEVHHSTVQSWLLKETYYIAIIPHITIVYSPSLTGSV